MQTEQNKIKPGKVWFLIPAILLVTAISLIVSFAVNMSNLVNAPAKQYFSALNGTVTVTEEANYSIYFEYRNNYWLDEDITFTFTPTPESGNDSVYQSQFANYSASYTINAVSGELISTVHLVPGTYQVSSDYTGTQSGADFVLSTGNEVLGIIGSVFTLIGGIFAFVLGIIILLVLGVLRSRSKKKIQEANMTRMFHSPTGPQTGNPTDPQNNQNQGSR